MPIFYQHPINESTRLGIWKIEETEEFFKGNVPQHRDVTHPHKRLQHLAGRFLLQYLFPDFPYELIRIADTRKPYLPNEQYHFSISHCGDYAAAIVSRDCRVGIDIEIPVEKIERLATKFLSPEEIRTFQVAGRGIDFTGPSRPADQNRQLLTLLWSAKEAVFKWYGNGGVDFSEHIRLVKLHESPEIMECTFLKANTALTVHYTQFEHLVLCWVVK